MTECSPFNESRSVYKTSDVVDLSNWCDDIAGLDSALHTVIKEERGAFVILNKKSIEMCSPVDGVKITNKIGSYSYFDYDLIKEIKNTDSILLLRKQAGHLLIVNPDFYYLIASFIPEKFITGVNMHSGCKTCTKECKYQGTRCEKVCSNCLKYISFCDGCKHNESIKGMDLE